MNRLQSLQNKFKGGLIKKEDYIKKMHDLHATLWEYADFLDNKNIDFIKILKSEIVFQTKEGIQMICDRNDERTTPVEILNFDDYEKEELNMMRTFLKKDSVVLDIGANIGWYTLNIAQNVPNGLIMAFEPVHSVYDYLKKNVILNNIKNVKLYNIALSDKNEKMVFYYDPKLSASTSLKKLHENRKKIKITYNAKRIDDFFDKKSTIDFIKCDVEGGEIFTIKGGLKIITRTLPIIFLEMLRKWSAKHNYHPNDIIAILDEIGYGCYYIKNNRLVRIKKVTEKTTSTNFYFLHQRKHRSFIKKLTIQT